MNATSYFAYRTDASAASYERGYEGFGGAIEGIGAA